jgi:two-component system sensor histidine kinase PilS (NtrC family)
VSLSPLVDAEGRLLGRILNFQDLTELRRMEDVAARAERLAAIGRLAAGIAHEIRNPLAAISGSVELLGQNVGAAKAPGEVSELMDIVLREVERLNVLITGLLDFARPRPLDPQRIDLSQLVRDTVRVFENDKQLASSGVSIAASEPAWVDGDPGQLRQVVWNLLRNAAQASPPGKPIAVTVSVGASADAPQKWAKVTIRDEGPGIPAEHLPRLFEPFFTLKQGGTGLGLATVHRIVEAHHGHVEIGQPTSGGTAVSVRLASKEPA